MCRGIRNSWEETRVIQLSWIAKRSMKEASPGTRCCCCRCRRQRRRRTCEKATTDFAFVKINDNMKGERERGKGGGEHTQNRMDFSIVGERRAIQSTGTKSAKVKGWRRKMLLLMRSSASRVLTSTPIELLSDTTTSVVAQLVKWEKSFLHEGREEITILKIWVALRKNILWNVG